VEYKPTKRRYCIVPPTIVWAVQSDDAAEGVFYGARSEKWGEQLANSFGPAFERIPQGEGRLGPQYWTLAGNRDELERRLAELDERVAMVEERGEDLLAALPTVSQALACSDPYEPSRDATAWERFTGSCNTRRWDRLPGEPTLPGLYREQQKGVYFRINDEGGRLRLKSPEEQRLGPWWELARTKSVSLTYDRTLEVLSVPKAVSLPIMIDRGLRLASGLCPKPSTDRESWEYVRIGVSRAHHVTRILEVPLEIQS